MNAKKYLLYLTVFVLFSLLFGQIPARVSAQISDSSFADLTKGKKISGFRTEAVYLDDSDQPMGGRFIHERTGFTLDLLRIQSVPQNYFWVNSFTVSDQGEPHTQEHLLITKGNKGRNINASENMTLSQSNAYTMQANTIYEFNTAGGSEVFYKLFDEYLDALLNPDYSEEEVRREVRNWGIAENADKTLRLEEKGSVYNEMTSSMSNPDWRNYDAAQRLVFGQAHPFSYNAGGSPQGIREMKTDDIKRFHDTNYHLCNMGAISSVPKEMPLAAVLSRIDAILNKVEPKSEKRDFPTLEKLPVPQPAPVGKIQISEFPSENAQQPASILLAYPANRKLDTTERLLLDNFLNTFVGDANTNLYKKLIDSKTRELDLGAQEISGYVDELPGSPVYIGLSNITATNLTDEKAALVQQKVMEEFIRVASFKDDSPELKEFNERFRSVLADYRRSLSKFINTPPGFGFRGGGNGYGWFFRMKSLNEGGDFRKSITMKPIFAEVEKMLASGKNIWRDYLAKWKFTETKPYAVVARANPKLIAQEENEKKMRAAAETAVLKKKYNVSDDQKAIQLYKADYDKSTAELEKLEKASQTKFIENPPLTLDDQLDFKETAVGGVKFVASNFENMTGATTGAALRLDTVPENELVYLSVMPQLLRNVGVIRDGKAISYEEMSELLRKEILSLNLGFTGNDRTNRYELIARGAGNDENESARAVQWMKLVLQNPNWRAENLPRIRDVVDQQLNGFRSQMQNSEENWVSFPANAYAKQDNPLALATSSFLTRAHYAQRLRWMLKDAGDAANRQAIDGFLTKLAAAKGSRDDLKSLLAAIQSDQSPKVSANLQPLAEDFAKLPAAARTLAVETAKDLEQNLNDIPDSSLLMDWAFLTNEMRQDLQQTPEKTLANLESVRKKLVNAGNARMFFIGSKQMQTALDAGFKDFLTGFDNSPVTKINYPNTRRIDERLKTRGAATENPVYVGLLAPNMTGGVFINSVPLANYTDTNRDKMLDYLASKLYGGGGAHSVFTKTIGAGLAYSNGVSSNPSSGRFQYYAERTPELAQTLRFVIGEVKRPLNESSLTEYVTALSFNSRAASPYEARGEAIAADLTDGVTPDVVRKFRQSILDLRKMPNLAEELFKRKDKVYQQILPGYGAAGKTFAGANYFVIGSEKQMAAYEAYLKSVEGTNAKLYRLYPRDFWMTK